MVQPIFLFYFCNWSETMRLSWHWCVWKVLARLCNKGGAELDRTTISRTKQCTRNLDPRWENGFVGAYIYHTWKSASCTRYHYVVFVFSCCSRNSRTLPYFDVETGFIKKGMKISHKCRKSLVPCTLKTSAEVKMEPEVSSVHVCFYAANPSRHNAGFAPVLRCSIKSL